MTSEFEALHANDTWDLVKISIGKKAIGCRWVYNVKHKVDGTIERLLTMFSDTSRGILSWVYTCPIMQIAQLLLIVTQIGLPALIREN